MPDVIPATFSDFKLIRGRKVAQLVLEIPIEKAQEALSVLGMPIPGQELWCAVARLKDEPKAKAKKKFEEHLPSAQVAMRCEREDFCEFLGTQYASQWSSHWRDGGKNTKADLTVKDILGIKSKTELDAKGAAFFAWNKLDLQFMDWLGTQKAVAQHEAYAR